MLEFGNPEGERDGARRPGGLPSFLVATEDSATSVLLTYGLIFAAVAVAAPLAYKSCDRATGPEVAQEAAVPEADKPKTVRDLQREAEQKQAQLREEREKRRADKKAPAAGAANAAAAQADGEGESSKTK